ncbi:MAG: sigma factor, partial [Roseococcus sp.]
MSDAAERLARIAQGDRAALHSLYKLQSVRLFGVAMAILRDRDAASDAVHDGFVKIARRAAQYDPERGVAEAWIGSVIRHAALDIARRRGRDELAPPVVRHGVLGGVRALHHRRGDLLHDAGAVHLPPLRFGPFTEGAVPFFSPWGVPK